VRSDRRRTSRRLEREAAVGVDVERAIAATVDELRGESVAVGVRVVGQQARAGTDSWTPVVAE
jgi:hypothetical protein